MAGDLPKTFSVTVQAGCGRQLKKVFKILQLDLDIA
jgi:hypothetical protein